MCTLSWLPAADGYTLCFNRDERFTRAPASPPALRDASGIRYLAPADGDFGGTWLAANQAGLSLGLLNLYRVPGYVPPERPRSRGLLVLDLIASQDQAEALARLEGSDLGVVQPFTLVALEPGRPAALAAWDGARLTLTTHGAAGLILTSSSVTEPEVAVARREQFAALPQVTVDALVELHQSHRPERGRLSICMHRPEAETQSFSRIAVTPDRVEFHHVPDAPCRGAPLPPVTLARHPASTPAPR